jgi:opacity protein-like surface antigen
MNQPTCPMPQPSTEGRRLFSTILERERPTWRLLFQSVTWIVPGIRRLGLTVFTTATLCSTVSQLGAADPSVEVFTQDTAPTGEGYVNFFPQLPFRWSITVGGGYDDNVNTTPNGVGSAFTLTNLSVSKDLRTDRTQLSLAVGGGVIHYFDRPGGTPTSYTGALTLTLQHSISERLTLAASINAAYQAEPDFGTDLGSTRHGGNYFSTANTFAARYALFPRLSTYTSYQLGIVKYEDNLVAIVQDRVDHTLGESFRYLWSERTTLIAEYRFTLIDYDTAPRDSATHFTLAGLDYQFSSRLSGTLVGGPTFRKFKEGSGDEKTYPYGSAALKYLISPSASLNWTASYSVEEPDFSETFTRTTLRTRTGLEFKYQPTRYVTANLALNYHHDDNTGFMASGLPGANQQDFSQNGFELVIGTRYAVTDRVALDLKFAHTDLDAIGGYSRNVYTTSFVFSF